MSERPGFPTKIRIGLFDYEIVDWNPVTAVAAHRYGECSTQERVIRVSRLHGHRQSGETLLHEIMHAIFNEWYIKDEDNEERTVGTMSLGLASTWRDNPEVFAWIDHALRFDAA